MIAPVAREKGADEWLGVRNEPLVSPFKWPLYMWSYQEAVLEKT